MAAATDNTPLKVGIEHFPGTYGYPLVGKTLGFLRKPWDFLSDLFSTYGPLNKANFLFAKSLMVADPEISEFLLRKENVLVGGRWPDATRRILRSESLAVLSGPIHTKQRKLMMRCFEKPMMEKLNPLVQETLDECFERWSKDGPNGTVIADQSQYISATVTLKVLLGISLTEEVISEVRLAMKQITAGLFSAPFNLPFSAYRKALNAREVVSQRLKGSLAAMREAIRSEDGSPDVDRGFNTVLEQLIAIRDEETATYFSDEKIENDAFLMLFAGSDTTSSSFNLLFLLLVSRPDILEKLRAEQAEYRKAHGDELTLDSYNNMPYLQAVITELLYKINPVQFMFRQALKDFEVPGTGVQVKKGTVLVVSVAGTHYNGNLADLKMSLEDKIKTLINPDALLESRAKGEEDKRLFTFGLGKRVCLGKPLALLEMCSMTVKVAREYDLKLVGSKFPEFNIFPVPVPKKMDDFRIQFIKREV